MNCNTTGYYYPTHNGSKIVTKGDDFMDALGNVKELMMARGWTEYRLAKESGLPQSTITNLFKRNNLPTITTLERICGAFGITLSEFFAETGQSVILNQEQTELLSLWAKLSSPQKTSLLEMMKHI